MKKQVLQFVSLLALLCSALAINAQRPEAAYVRAGVAKQLKKRTETTPFVNKPVPLNARVAVDCPACQQITFGSFSPNASYISAYGADSIWYNTYKYVMQDPVWPGGYLNFDAGCLNFTHYADTSFGPMSYWDGFTVSKTNVVPFPCDTACSDACNGLQSQFSSITGGGVSGSSDPYVVGYYGYNSLFFPENHTTLTLNSPSSLCGLYVTNNAYAVKSMKCGDFFAHKFGPGDWLKLTIEGFSGGVSTGTVDYYLADFTGSNAYIVDSWKWVNLTSLGTVDSLAFYLNTSDVGEWGPNTPMYFCIDNIKVGASPSCGTCAPTDNTHNVLSANALKVTGDVVADALSITPNPAATQITVQAKAGSQLEIFDASGIRKYNIKMTTDKQTVSVSDYHSGVYIVRINNKGRVRTLSFIKK